MNIHKLAAQALFLAATGFLFAIASVAYAGSGEAWAERDRVMIEDIQESLYILGYIAIDDVDAVAGPKTALAIRRFERDNGLRPSGQFTGELRTLLLDTAFPERLADTELIGAVSVAADMKWGASFARYTAEVAVAAAIRRCEQRSRRPGDCRGHTHVATGHDWIVTVNCARFYSTSHGASVPAAEANAIATVREHGDRSYCRRIAEVNATFGQEIDELEERALTAHVDPPVPEPRPAPALAAEPHRRDI